MNAHAIEIENLHVRAGQRTVLASDSLNTRDGTMTAVLGPNGSGKTTLLRAILGLQASCSGQIRVLGLQVRGASASVLRQLRRQMGYVPQLLSTRSETPLTVREVVVMGRTARAGLMRPPREMFTDDRVRRLYGERLEAVSAGGRYAVLPRTPNTLWSRVSDT